MLLLNCVPLFVTSWTLACLVPLSMEISRQKYWSGWPFPSPVDSTQGWNLHLLHWQADSLLLSHQGSTKILISVVELSKL